MTPTTGKSIEKTEEMETFIHNLGFICVYSGLVQLVRSGHTSPSRPVSSSHCPLHHQDAPSGWCPWDLIHCIHQRSLITLLWRNWSLIFSNYVALLSWSTMCFYIISLCNVSQRNICTREVRLWIWLSGSNLCAKCFLLARVFWLFLFSGAHTTSIHSPALMYSSPRIYC